MNFIKYCFCKYLSINKLQRLYFKQLVVIHFKVDKIIKSGTCIKSYRICGIAVLPYICYSNEYILEVNKTELKVI